jgi:chromosome segregation ATPase
VPSTLTTEVGKNEPEHDSIGQNFLALFQKATSLAGGNSRKAVDLAQKLSDRLGLTENRVAALEEQVTTLQAEVEFYREKSRRAEDWLSKISGEIQERPWEP